MLTLTALAGGIADCLLTQTSCLIGALGVFDHEMYTWITYIHVSSTIIICDVSSVNNTSSESLLPVFSTITSTDTFWPALTTDGDMVRLEYLKVVYDLQTVNRYCY